MQPNAQDNDSGQIFCGKIFRNATGTLKYTCMFCKLDLKDGPEFEYHILEHFLEEQFLVYLSTDIEDKQIDNLIEIEISPFDENYLNDVREVNVSKQIEIVSDCSISAGRFESVSDGNTNEITETSSLTINNNAIENVDKNFNLNKEANGFNSYSGQPNYEILEEFLFLNKKSNNIFKENTNIKKNVEDLSKINDSEQILCEKEELRVKCDCCYRLFPCNGLRDLHIHPSAPPYVKCKLCPTFFPDRRARMAHLRVHKIPQEKQFECPHCHCIFGTENALSTHVFVTAQQVVLPRHEGFFSKHPKSVKTPSFECDLCGRKFMQKIFIEKHLKKHVENQLDCMICSKHFKESRNLRKHMLSHTGQKPFKCAVCLKGFQHESYLTIHMRNHSGQKPYVCQQCAKAFSCSGDLTTHIKKIHERQKNHVCKICMQRFRLPTLLRDHIRAKHTNERPYNCLDCGQAFATAKTFRQHTLLHQEKRFQCTYCDKKFAQSSGRRGHEKNVHEKGLN